MPDLLVEVGCEELPASFVERAFIQLHQNISSALSEAFNQRISGQCCGTPRRLIVSIDGLLGKQDDATKEVRGPALKAAFDDSGNPLPPLLGFCKSSGVQVESVVRKDGYIWVNRFIKGKSTYEILQEVLPSAILNLSFDKSMRWGTSRTRFARPIRWILAILDGEIVPFEIEGIPSGNESRGHRFYAPDVFKVTTFRELENELSNRKVEIWLKRREARIVEEAKTMAKDNAHGIVDLSESLIEENANLTEWPDAVCGSFPEQHLELPDPVLVTSMAKHLKMFPIRNDAGQLKNKFIFIRNGGEDGVVRRGNEWVLNARLDDAQFFYQEDRKFTIAEFLDRTDGIVFQAQLGSVRDRSERLHDLCGYLAENFGASAQEVDQSSRAGLYAKADLSTGLVSEFASLQGIIGGIYGRRDGFGDSVCHAISTQYEYQKNLNLETSEQRIAIILAIGDALDKLAGYLGIGLAPSGSSDPYGLRRAATTLIECAWAWRAPIPGYKGALIRALDLYRHQGFILEGEKALRLLHELFVSRYEALMSSVRYDLTNAAVMADILGRSLDPRLVRLRMEVMSELCKEPQLIQTATRPLNLVDSALKKKIDISQAETLEHLDSEPGARLAVVNQTCFESIKEALVKEDRDKILVMVRKLVPHIDQFIDGTMIMVDDQQTRSDRLGLLRRVCETLQLAGDFTKVVLEKS